MSDERLREAERRWRETGSVDDEARYLLERVRVGDLTRERLELAAYCGHEGACSAAGVVAPPHDIDLRDWGEQAAQLGKPACVLLALLSASRARHLWRSPAPETASLVKVVEWSQEWLRCPCREHEAMVEEGLDAAWDMVMSLEGVAWTAAGAAAEAARAVTAPDAQRAAESAGGAAFCAADALATTGTHADLRREIARELLGVSATS